MRSSSIGRWILYVAGLPHRFGEALQRIRIRDINVSVAELHGARIPQLPEGSGDRLPVGPHHARELVVGVAGGYPAAALGRYDALAFAKAEDKTDEPGRHFLSGQIREPPLAGGEPLAQNANRLHPYLGGAAHEVVECFSFEDS